MLCVRFAYIEIYIRGNDQGNALSLLTLVFRFDVIFHRHFSGRFCRDNEHLWHHTNKEAVDFHTLTFQREMGAALDVLCTGYHPRILMYALDKLFFVFKKLQVDDFHMQCVVAYEILQIVFHRCMEWCKSEKNKDNTLGDTYLTSTASCALLGPCMMGYSCPLTSQLSPATMIGIVWWQGP